MAPSGRNPTHSGRNLPAPERSRAPPETSRRQLPGCGLLERPHMSKRPRASIAVLAALLALPAVSPVRAVAGTVTDHFGADADTYVAPGSPDTNYGNQA